jgi:xanthine dehydrogenase/oxidase
LTPGAYKIPAFGDIPDEFNVSLLRGASNPKAVYSSKGIGEPPLFLSSSVFFAVRQAIKAARKEVGLEKVHFQLHSPLSAERIRMACEDHITQQVPELPQEGAYRPWGIQV